MKLKERSSKANSSPVAKLFRPTSLSLLLLSESSVSLESMGELEMILHPIGPI